MTMTYKEVLGETLPWLEELERAKCPAGRPTALTVSEVRHLLAQSKCAVRSG